MLITTVAGVVFTRTGLFIYTKGSVDCNKRCINTIKVIDFYCNLNLLKVGVALITSVGSMFYYKMVTV